METNGPADVIRIGRLTLLTCQRCGAHHAINSVEAAQVEMDIATIGKVRPT